MPDNLDVPVLVGTWYVHIADAALTAQISWMVGEGYCGRMLSEDGGCEELDEIAWDEVAGICAWRRHGQEGWQWMRALLVAGILHGRCSAMSPEPARPDLSAYQLHVTGWNSAVLDGESLRRVYDLLLDTCTHACLRLDQDVDGHLLGRLKVVATRASAEANWDAAGEGAEYDLEVTHWDGTHLMFCRREPGTVYWYTGQAAGRTISGVCTSTALVKSLYWHGVRCEVLAYGLVSRTPAEREQWQTTTRLRLRLLMQNGCPDPLTITWCLLQDHVEPLTGLPSAPLSRDDHPAQWPQAYTKRELLLTCTIADPYGSGTLERQVHAWLAVPTAPPERVEGYRVALVVNGHGVAESGGARAMFDPANGHYWYGDAFARRGYVVLAVDVRHRPLADRMQLYQDLKGTDASLEQHFAPAITSSLFPHDSDWEEDGERVWDVSRALDLLLSGQLGIAVDAQRVLVTGLSMGGEVATLCGALDPRISLVIPAAFAPDLQVLHFRQNHPCWRWQNANLPEYTSVSDWHALIAPRPLIVQTGRTDTTFSSLPSPFAGDKQMLRRSRAAYAEASAHLVHYLHTARPGELTHHYRVGDRLSTHPTDNPTGITVPIMDTPDPADPWSVAWQSDGQTTVPALGNRPAPTLFDYIEHFWTEHR